MSMTTFVMLIGSSISMIISVRPKVGGKMIPKGLQNKNFKLREHFFRVLLLFKIVELITIPRE